jgi:lysine decarboxylase
VIDGLVLSGGHPSYLAPEYHSELGMALGVTPEALSRALEGAPEARAAFIVSPTYYGMAADIGACAEVAHAAGKALVVDSAWGAHFGFHPQLPESPLALGADAVLSSTHKIVGSLTQSAMVHVASDGLIDPDAVARAVRLVRSTSPSALLFASLDAARRQLAVHGDALLERTLAAAERTAAAIDAVPGCEVVGGTLVGRPGVAGWDPLRLVVDVRGTGRTGYEMAEALRGSYDSYPELASAWRTSSPRRCARSHGPARFGTFRWPRWRPRPRPPRPHAMRSSGPASRYRSSRPSDESHAKESPATRQGSRRFYPGSA